MRYHRGPYEKHVRTSNKVWEEMGGGTALLGSLHAAVAGGTADDVRASLAAGGIVDAGDLANMRTPLHFAAMRGDPEIVQILLEAKASPKARDSRQETPLHLAVRTNAARVVELLLDSGASLTAVNDKNRTPFHLAAEFGDAKIVRMLLARGADPSIEATRNVTAEAIARKQNHLEIAEMLRKHTIADIQRG